MTIPTSMIRLFYTSDQRTDADPNTLPQMFTSETAVANYYGVSNLHTTLAQEYFGPNGEYNGLAGMIFVRSNLGQRPHLMGSNVTNLQGVSGNIALTFDGFSYSGNVNLAGVTNYTTAATDIQQALNAVRQTGAVTIDDTITPGTITFTGYFKGSQLYVTDGTPLVIGGVVYGKDIAAGRASQVIQVGSGSDHYHVFGGPEGVGTYPPETMTETYGVLTVGGVKSGTVSLGEFLSDAQGNVAEDTAIDYQLSPNQWIVSQSQSLSEAQMAFKAPLLTVAWNSNNRPIIGQTENPNYFDVTPNSWGGFDNDPSSLSYATGTAATELGLTQGQAILSSPGGVSETVAQDLNSIVAAGIQFGSFQDTPDSAQFNNALSLWATKHPEYDYLSNSSTTPPPGMPNGGDLLLAQPAYESTLLDLTRGGVWDSTTLAAGHGTSR